MLLTINTSSTNRTTDGQVSKQKKSPAAPQLLPRVGEKSPKSCKLRQLHRPARVQRVMAHLMTRTDLNLKPNPSTRTTHPHIHPLAYEYPSLNQPHPYPEPTDSSRPLTFQLCTNIEPYPSSGAPSPRYPRASSRSIRHHRSSILHYLTSPLLYLQIEQIAIMINLINQHAHHPSGFPTQSPSSLPHSSHTSPTHSPSSPPTSPPSPVALPPAYIVLCCCRGAL